MKNYTELNQQILDEWKDAYVKDGGNADLFSEDGIMNRGEIQQHDNGICTQDPSGKENELWSNAPIRILYLSKDQNVAGDDEAWDVRAESYHKKYSSPADNLLSIQYRFPKMLVRTLYGLAKATPSSYLSYEDAIEKDSEALAVADTFPFARINCKKEAGGPACLQDKLNQNMEKYQQLLSRQIANLDADVFVCCGNQNETNVIMDFLNANGYNFANETEKESYDVHYDAIHNKIAIDSYHLSYTFCPEEKLYDEIVKTYHYFLKAHPDFIKSHRS